MVTKVLPHQGLQEGVTTEVQDGMAKVVIEVQDGMAKVLVVQGGVTIEVQGDDCPWTWSNRFQSLEPILPPTLPWIMTTAVLSLPAHSLGAMDRSLGIFLMEATVHSLGAMDHSLGTILFHPLQSFQPLTMISIIIN